MSFPNLWNKGLIILAAGVSVVLFSSGFTHAVENQSELQSLDAIMDAEIYGKKGEILGEVDDFVLKRNGRVKKITLEIGGFLDIGDKLIAVSFKRFDGVNDGKFTLNISRDQGKDMPEFNYYEEGFAPEFYYRSLPKASPHYHKPPGSYYYYPPPGRLQRENYFRYPQYPAETPYFQDMPKGLETYDWYYSPSRILASVVLDRRVTNEEGKLLGIVEDLLINEENDIERIVISGSNMFSEDFSVEAPYQPLGFTAYGLVYDVSIEQLNNYPRSSRKK